MIRLMQAKIGVSLTDAMPTDQRRTLLNACDTSRLGLRGRPIFEHGFPGTPEIWTKSTKTTLVLSYIGAESKLQQDGTQIALTDLTVLSVL